MIQVTPQMRILLALQPADFRKGIDGMAEQCRAVLSSDPFSGSVFVFCNRKRSSIKILVYDGRGFWLCQKRLSKGRFPRWSYKAKTSQNKIPLETHELSVLLNAGDPFATNTLPIWRPVCTNKEA